MMKTKHVQIQTKPEQMKIKPATKTPLVSDPLTESLIKAERIGTFEVKWSKRRHAWVKQMRLDDSNSEGFPSKK